MRTQNHNIKILWDGKSALVVHKPAGIATQAAPGVESLETVLRRQLADRTDYLAFPHRLDRPVSGVLLVAVRKRAARLLCDQFASRKVTKTYLAWVTGKVEPQQLGLWVDHLRKVTDRPHAEIVEPHAEGARLAETTTSLRLYDAANNRSLLELAPLTGRMHQLRAQAAHRGIPIIGDRQYGGQGIPGPSSHGTGGHGTGGHGTGRNGAGGTGNTVDRSGEDSPASASQSTNEIFKTSGQNASSQSTGGRSYGGSNKISGKAGASGFDGPTLDSDERPPDRILLQAQQITFHDPSNGSLQTVTASDELPKSV